MDKLHKDVLAEIENVELRYTISNINIGGKQWKPK
jgi:hypothetical protein